MDLRPIYYIYRYLTKDTYEIFYAGKGHGNRAEDFYHHNDECKEIIARQGVIVEYIFKYMTELEAFETEIKFITFYKSKGLCKANKTLGGDGLSGYKFSKESKEKMSAIKKGRRWTKRHKENISKGHGSMPFEVYNIKFEFIGIWKSISQCAHDLDINRVGISAVLNKRKVVTACNYFFRYVGDTTSLDELYKPYNKNGMAKKVIDLKTGQIWNCLQHAAKELNIKYATLSHWLNGIAVNKSTLRFLVDKDKPLIKRKNNNQREVIDLFTGQIWDSAKEAAIELKILPKILRKWLRENTSNPTNLRYNDKPIRISRGKYGLFNS